MTFDTRIFYDLNHFARDTPWLHPIVSGYATYGLALFAALWAPVGMLAALAINQPIAATINETRPCQALHDIVVLHCNTDPGFPSDHAVMAGAVTAGVWLVSHRLGLLAALAAVAMAWARVYIGAHYPQDVLAGLILGAAASLTGYLLLRPLLRRLLTMIAATGLRILIVSVAATPVGMQNESR